MDLRIRSGRELVAQLSHANSVVENCRKSIVRTEVDDGEGIFASMHIDRMISNLEIMKRYLQKEAVLWAHLKAANKTDD